MLALNETTKMQSWTKAGLVSLMGRGDSLVLVGYPLAMKLQRTLVVVLPITRNFLINRMGKHELPCCIGRNDD